MRVFTVFLLVAALVVLFGCESKRRSSGASPGAASQETENSASQTQTVLSSGSSTRAALVTTIGGREDQFLPDAEAAEASANAADRKIIRNGELTLEIESPMEGQSRIAAIAESLGGFVVTSEFKQNNKGNQSQPSETVTVVARVPSTRFTVAMEQIRNLGRKISEKDAGQDVSEEYLDLETRIRTKKALETQFLEIMKQARKVSEALEVQSQLADVRTEIERLEGRRRFLENQAAFSTITTTLQMPAPIVTATPSGFGHSIKEALGDGIDTAAAILLGLIRIVIALIPVGLFIALPAWLVWRGVRRRLPKKPEPVTES